MNIYSYQSGEKSYLIFEVENSNVSNYQVEMINNNLNKSFLPVKEMQINDVVKVHVDVTNKRSIKDRISSKPLGYSEFLKIITSMCDMLIKVEEYLLKEQNLVINNNTVFIDNSNEEVSICYLPILNSELNNDIQQFKKFIVDLSNHVNTRGSKEELEIISNINKYLYSPNITPIRLKRYIESLQQIKKENYLVIDKKDEEKIDRKEEKNSYLKVFKRKSKSIMKDDIRNKENIEVKQAIINTAFITVDNERVELNKDIFLLGRMADAVDYVLNSNAIGRVHARIERISGEYFITDLASKNGTHVNGSRLLSNEKYKLESGCEIKMANLTVYFNS